MAFKSFSVALGTSNTDVVECPATQQGAAVLAISNITAGALTYALKIYRQATGQTVTVATGVSVAANTAVKFPAPISLEASDKIIMTSSSASNLLVTGTFTYSAATPAAVGFTPLGAWDDEATYAINDVVDLNGNSYISRQDDNLNQNPGTQTDYWALLAEKGETGAGDLTAANNLSDLADAATARTNLGLGTGNSPELTAVNLGHASDTTLGRYGAGVIAVEGAAIYPGVPVVSLSADTTLDITHANVTILHPSTDTNNRTFTIPANASVAYPLGTVIAFDNLVNTVSIAITSDTLLLAGPGSTGTRSLAANGQAVAKKVESTTWMISGIGLS